MRKAQIDNKMKKWGFDFEKEIPLKINQSGQVQQFQETLTSADINYKQCVATSSSNFCNKVNLNSVQK